MVDSTIRSEFQAHPSRLGSPSPWPLSTSLCLPATTFSSHSSRASPWNIRFFKYLYILFLKWIGTLDSFNTKIYSITLYKSTVFSIFFIWVLSYFQLIDIAFQSQFLGFLIVILSAILWIECITRYLDKNEFLFFAGSILCTILLILGFTLIFLDIIIWLLELSSYIYMVGSKIIKNLIGNKKTTGSNNQQGSGSNKPRKNQTILTRAQKRKEKEKRDRKVRQDRYMAKKKSKETPEDAKARLAKDAQDKKDKKANETPEQRKDRLARNAKALRDKKANETPEQKKARLAQRVQYKENWRAKKAQ
jgi:glucan phosphoethanolaminetransferase (alkaline phosphatase superfamily)